MSDSEKILIVGSGQHCRVVLYNMRAQGVFSPVGIADIDPGRWGTEIEGVPIIKDYQDFDDATLDRIGSDLGTRKFFIGLGAMKIRQRLFEYFISMGWQSVNIIHPDAVVSPTASLGTGILIEAGCLITPSPIIGDNVVVNTGSQVNHDNVIGNSVYLASGVLLSGGVVIGENTLIDDGVIVCLGKQVGKGCIVGAGSVITKNIPDRVIAYGNPCKVIRPNDKF